MRPRSSSAGRNINAPVTVIVTVTDTTVLDAVDRIFVREYLRYIRIACPVLIRPKLMQTFLRTVDSFSTNIMIS